MTPRVRQGLIIAGFAVLAVIAAIGWTRRPSTAQANNAYSTNVPAYSGPANSYTQPAANEQPASAPPPIAEEPAYAQPANMTGPAGQPCVSMAPYRTPLPEYAERHYVRLVRPATQAAAPSSRETALRPATKGRSTKMSAAIVAGGAGTGAAVGALAGGGKGAAIGALAGGAGGFIYDRLTHTHHTGL